MRRFGIFPAAGIALLSCLGAYADGTPANALTEDEKAAGWQLMFDGKGLAGWHSYRKTSISTNGWGIDDSALYRRDQGAGSILSPERFAYRDFEFSVDWKVPDNGNSGIFIRYLETEESEYIRTGPESQVCGRAHSDYGTGTGIRSPGACYDMYAPSREWIRPANQYNTFRIIAFGNRIAHYGNGQKLLEYEIGSPDWQSRFASSKYQSFPLYGDLHAGKVFLQDHGSPIWFRNLKIRPLAADPWSDSAFVWPDGSVAIRIAPASREAPAPRLLMGGNGLRLRGADDVWRDVLGRGRVFLCGACRGR